MFPEPHSRSHVEFAAQWRVQAFPSYESQYDAVYVVSSSNWLQAKAVVSLLQPCGQRAAQGANASKNKSRAILDHKRDVTDFIGRFAGLTLSAQGR